jgi:hypothetical protein
MTRSVTGLSQWRLGFDPRSGFVGFVVDKIAFGWEVSDTSVSPHNSYETSCFILNYYPIIRHWICSILTASLNNQLRTNKKMSIPICVYGRGNFGDNNRRNKKFWEEIVAYFPSTHGPRRRRRVQQFCYSCV